MLLRKHAMWLPAQVVAAAFVTVFGLYALHLTATERLETHSSVRLKQDARRGRQQRVPGDTAPGAPLPAPVIAPFLFNGPSNQIYQAKLVVWSMREDSTGATLVLPPILPHFSQRRKNDEPVPYSAFFDVGKVPPAATTPSPLHAPNLVEEQDLWDGTAPPAVAAAAAATINHTCTVYVGQDLDDATGAAASMQRMERCQKYAQWWADRAAGRACTDGFTYLAYAGGLVDLARDLATNEGQTANLDGGSVPALVCACYLETFLTPAILFEASDKPPSGPGGSYVLAGGKGPGSLPETDTEAAGAAWVSAADVLKFRGDKEPEDGRPFERDKEREDGRPLGSDPISSKPFSPSTLALQMRVPDYIVLAKNRSTQLETYCLGGALKCDPTKHMVLPRDKLLDLVGGAVDGTHPVLARARSAASAWFAASAATGMEHDGGGPQDAVDPGGVATLPAGGVEPLGAFSHVHLLTNDELLGADVTNFLRGRGLRVTSSPDRGLSSLMQDYKAAVDAAVFWGTRGSTISANIVHARLAAGRPARTTVYWEDVVTKRG